MFWYSVERAHAARWRGCWRWCRHGCACTASSATSPCPWSHQGSRRATCASWRWRAWGSWACAAAMCARARSASRCAQHCEHCLRKRGSLTRLSACGPRKCICSLLSYLYWDQHHNRLSAVQMHVPNRHAWCCWPAQQSHGRPCASASPGADVCAACLPRASTGAWPRRRWSWCGATTRPTAAGRPS